MKNKTDLVSCIIPFFNSEKYLAQTITSALKQTYPALEIILVDDGSTDNSYQIASEYKSVTIIRQDNQGVSCARNTGIKSSNGKFISFLDADDYWSLEKTTRQMALLQRNPQADVIINSFENFIEPGEKVPDWLDRRSFLDPVTGTMPLMGTMLVRYSDFTRVGLFDEGLDTGEDLDWLARAKDFGLNIVRNPDVVMYRRLHSSNLSYQSRGKHQHLIQIMRESIKRKKANSGPKKNGR